MVDNNEVLYEDRIEYIADREQRTQLNSFYLANGWSVMQLDSCASNDYYGCYVWIRRKVPTQKL